MLKHYLNQCLDMFWPVYVETTTQVCSCAFYTIFENTVFTERLWETASFFNKKWIYENFFF